MGWIDATAPEKTVNPTFLFHQLSDWNPNNDALNSIVDHNDKWKIPSFWCLEPRN